MAFIGLGVMGFPMAGHLAAAGHEVTVWNRTAAKAEAWAARHEGRVAGSAREAAAAAEVAFACVGSDDDLRAVAHGEAGILAGLAGGALLVDHTTASAAVAREMHAAAAERSAGFLDAPVSGGQRGAEAGTLSVMCGGDEADFARAEPVQRAYAKAVTLMGPAGSGQLAKMASQICLATAVQGLAEAISLARASGLDLARLYPVLAAGAAFSRPMESRWGPMTEGRFDFGGFAVDWMRKDLGICLDEARRAGTPLPSVALIAELYGLVQQAGHGRDDMSSLILALKGGEEPPAS